MQGMDMPGMDMAQPESPKPAKPPAKKTHPSVTHQRHETVPPRSHAAKHATPAVTPAHDMPSMPMDHAPAPPVTDQHAGMSMDMPGMTMPAPAAAQPRTPIPVLTDADRAAALPPSMTHPGQDDAIHGKVSIDRLDVWRSAQGTAVDWETQAWFGTDMDRLWLRSEGERRNERTEAADVEVLYGRHIATWWDGVVGIRHDLRPGSSQDFAAIGVIGTAPCKIDVAATVYIGASGQTSARIEAHYDVLLSNRLILQPQVEANLYGRNDPRRGIGSGLATLESGLRLRYEFTRRFAPYVGVVHEQAFAGTADALRAAGEGARDTRWVVGFRFWF
ncbi:MAG: copper resistance protein B [Proteobacteria bacterium]|nr:copper resistance protein B [Pseudomonadota bacterium]